MKKNTLFAIALLASVTIAQSQNIHRIEAASGRVIGMTSGGGSKGYGVIYQYNPGNGNDTVSVSLGGSGLNYGQPGGSPLQASNGRIYGMTSIGGTYNYG